MPVSPRFTLIVDEDQIVKVFVYPPLGDWDHFLKLQIPQKENDIMEFDFQFLDDTYSLERENKDEEVKS